jgi:hypothetical protein
MKIGGSTRSLEPTDSRKADAIGRMFRAIGYHEMTWQIAWIRDRTKHTEGTLQQFFRALNEALLHLQT